MIAVFAVSQATPSVLAIREIESRSTTSASSPHTIAARVNLALGAAARSS